jgi:CheY-like chemotaxis protein
MPQQTHIPRLLVVDDEPAIRRFLTTSLGSGESLLYQAKNGGSSGKRVPGILVPDPACCFHHSKTVEEGLEISIDIAIGIEFYITKSQRNFH